MTERRNPTQSTHGEDHTGQKQARFLWWRNGKQSSFLSGQGLCFRGHSVAAGELCMCMISETHIEILCLFFLNGNTQTLLYVAHEL